MSPRDVVLLVCSWFGHGLDVCREGIPIFPDINTGKAKHGNIVGFLLVFFGMPSGIFFVFWGHLGVKRAIHKVNTASRCG